MKGDAHRGLGVDCRRSDLTTRERTTLETYLRALLDWQCDLSKAPTWRGAELPRATAFVSLQSSADGKLRGSVGSSEGTTSQRTFRAFLGAMHDARFPQIAPGERSMLAAQVSFLHDLRVVPEGDLASVFEPGVHGLGAREPNGAPVLLLPDVALSGQMNTERMRAALVHKNGGREFSADATTYVFRSTRAVARPYELPDSRAPIDAAAAWLAGMVQKDGSIVYEVDPRSRIAAERGPMHHARTAVAIEALAAHGGFAREVRRARKHLTAEIRSALAGATVADWPESAAQKAGTLAHAVKAGVAVRAELLALAGQMEVASSAWHAPQVAAALGAECPNDLWQACASRVTEATWSPWTALAARAIGDDATYRRSLPGLLRAIEANGGVRAPNGQTPETALTALVVEALSGEKAASPNVKRARAFVAAQQFSAATTPLAVDPRTAEGAFAGSPVDPRLRIDVTAHALLALLASASPALTRRL